MRKIDGAWLSSDHIFGPEHPSAAGHFPGNPIIPGAFLLDQVLRTTGADTYGTPCEFRSAKFLRPVRPGDGFTIRWQRLDNGDVKFECWLSERGELALFGAIKPRE